MIQFFFRTEKSVRMFSHVFCVFLLLLITGCSGSGDGSSSDFMSESENPESETGTIAFTIENPEQAARKSGISGLVSGTADMLGPRSAMAGFTDDCDTDIVEISALVYDESNAEMLSAGPWPCSAHSGKIGGVRPGSDRKLLLLAKNDKGSIIYRTEATGITVTGGQTNEVSIAPFQSFVPVLTREDALLKWQNVSGAVSYRVVITEENIDTPLADETIAAQSYAPQNLSEIITYYANVYAIDSYGHQGGESEKYTFAALTVPPVPANIKAENGFGQITVTWDAADNADFYVVRYKTSESDWISAGETEGTSITVSGLTAGTSYTFSVQAVNSVGASAYSVETSVTPWSNFSGIWYYERKGTCLRWDPNQTDLPSDYPKNGIIYLEKAELNLFQTGNQITGKKKGSMRVEEFSNHMVEVEYDIKGTVIGNVLNAVETPLHSYQEVYEYFEGGGWISLYNDENPPEVEEVTYEMIFDQEKHYLIEDEITDDDSCGFKNYDGSCVEFHSDMVPDEYDYVKISD